MTNLILFLNSFLSYLLVVAVFVLVGGAAIFAGITLRKRKDAKEAAELSETSTETGVANEV